MVASAGNVVGCAKNRKGAKLSKDRLTAGIFWNATRTAFFKPIFIGTAKRPRCFGNH